MESLSADGEYGVEEPCFGPLSVTEFVRETWGLAKRLTRSVEDAENLLQDVEVKLLEGTARWPEDPEVAGAFASRVMTNLWIDQHRHEVLVRPHNQVVEYDAHRDVRVAAGTSVEDRAIATADLRGPILGAVEQLTAALREVVDLALELVEGSLAARSREEISQELGIPPGTVGRRLHEARRMLQARLAELNAENGADR